MVGCCGGMLLWFGRGCKECYVLWTRAVGGRREEVGGCRWLDVYRGWAKEGRECRGCGLGDRGERGERGERGRGGGMKGDIRVSYLEGQECV